MATSVATVFMTVLSMTFQQSDTTITVAAGARLDVETMGGSIVVGTWDRNEVRVQATHGSRDVIDVETSGSVVRVRAERSSGFGFTGIVDYQINVPATMDLELSGINVGITVEGTRGRVNAQSVQGDITVRGGRGEITLESVTGRVELDGVEGSVKATSVAGGVRLRNVTGDVEAESVSGSVVLENVTSSRVNASSVSGRIYYDGIIANNGRYSFATHSGWITLGVQPDLNATISVALLSGSFSSTIGTLAGGAGDRGRRQTFTVGAGSAFVELESFSGTVRIVRRGEVPAPTADASGAPRGLGLNLDDLLNSIF
jgi:hypothetical protein